MQEVTFTRNDSLDHCGTYHLTDLPATVTDDVIRNMFGDFEMMDEEYSMPIVLTNDVEVVKEFVSFNPIGCKPSENSTGIYSVYSRDGRWRIGGNDSLKFVNELREWIVSNAKFAKTKFVKIAVL